MEELESKASSVGRHLAGRLLDVDLGGRIPTTADIADELSVGFGTVEKALSALRNQNIIKLRSRGQMGTFLLERDLPRQWQAAGYGTVIGLLPLPNALPFVGIATGVTAWFEATGIPFAINFRNGATTRLTALKERRADLVAMSKHSATHVCAEDPSLVTVMELPPGSYYVGHDIVFRRKAGSDRSAWRIGVDPTSLDHVKICEALFPGAEQRDVRYVNLPYAIAKGDVDASVLHSRALIPLECAADIEAEPAEATGPLFDIASVAVLVARRDNSGLRALFRQLGGAETIHATQMAVINRQREPEF